MGQLQIQDKLGRLLAQPIIEESQVVYLLVEARKMLARERHKATQYPLLKFFADWSVHSEKDRITPEVEYASQMIYRSAAEHIKNRFPNCGVRSPIEQFAHLDDLRAELSAFLADFNLPGTLTAAPHWLEFSDRLIKVLEEQPIRFKKGPVKIIQFEPSAPLCVLLKIVFQQPVDGYAHYTYGNRIH